MIKFDFDGALRVAKELDRLAETVHLKALKHANLRDTAVAAWEGPLGDQVKVLRDAHDRKGDPLPEQLRDESERWLINWVFAVNTLNHDRFKEAEELQADYNRKQRSMAESLRAGQSVAGGDTSPLPRDVQRWIDDPPTVQYPAAADRPRGFTPTQSFARYRLNGDVYELSYHFWPEAAAVTGFVG